MNNNQKVEYIARNLLKFDKVINYGHYISVLDIGDPDDIEEELYSYTFDPYIDWEDLNRVKHVLNEKGWYLVLYEDSKGVYACFEHENGGRTKTYFSDDFLYAICDAAFEVVERSL